MEMARTTFFSRHLFEFLRDEEEAVLKATNDSDREAVMKMYHKSKITLEDIQREYTPEEKRMLCERTKVRVKMYDLNIVWDAKQQFDKKKRLENKSESFVNRMFVKAHTRRMIKPYSDEEREKYKVLAACQTKKENNARLDRWKRQHLRTCKSNGLNGCCELSANISINDSSEEEYDAEVLTVAPPVSVEPTQAPFESQPQSQSDEGTIGDLLDPIPPAPLESQPQSQSDEGDLLDPIPPAPLESQPQSQSDEGTIGDLLDPIPPAPLESQPQSQSDEGTIGDLLDPIPPAPLESQPQSQSSESAMDELLQRFIKQPPAQKPLPNVDSEPNLWGIGDDQEVEVHVEEGNDGPPPAHEDEKELNSNDWNKFGHGIYSEGISIRTIPNTQNTEPPDYECFGTQVVAASTQDTVESQQFF